MWKKVVLIFIILFVVISMTTFVDTLPLTSTKESEEILEKVSTQDEPEIVEEIIEEVLEEEIPEEPTLVVVKKENRLDELNFEESFEEEELDETDIEEEPNKPKKSYVIAIDAGHQQKGNNDKEPVGPGALESKPKVAQGTTGIVTNIPEYELTLEISLKLKEALISEGYKIVMIRETNDVDISNAERAVIANESGADVFLRIHANGSEDSSIKGITILCPSSTNEYCSDIAEDSYKLSDAILTSMVEKTGDKNLGVSENDSMTGINWCEIPVAIIETGFMTNPESDELLNSSEYQEKIVNGIIEGVNKYFGEE